jgi:hypothetical protein
MTLCRVLLLTVCVIFGSGAMALGQEIGSLPALGAANPQLDAIRSAPDPSATIEAYARGVADGRVSVVELEQAYVRRMIELGAPELAEAQAHDLVHRGASDAFIAGVAAYDAAARGDARRAIANLKLALTAHPDDPLLLRTAGQVVAWYDSQPGQSNLSKEDAAGVEWLRANGKGSQEFADAYRMAAETRRQTQAEQTTTTQQNRGTQTTVTSERSSSERRSSSAESSSSGSSDQTSTSYPYYSYPYSYSGSGYYYPYWGYYGSGYSIIAVRDRALYRDGAGLVRGATGDWRNPGRLPVNPNDPSGRAFPTPPNGPGNRAVPTPASPAGRPPPRPQGQPPQPPRPQSPPRPPGPPPGPPLP